MSQVLAGQTRTGGEMLVDLLIRHGLTHSYGVPGESYLAVLDAIYDRPEFNFIACRHEGGAAYMAEANAKLTGGIGVCFVTRGPGACNGSIGVHTAMQDSTPMLYFIGQVARDQVDREAFQEIDYRQMFGSVAKWVTQIEDPMRLPELISRACSVALSGRPGPVVIALPEDMLTQEVIVPEVHEHVPTAFEWAHVHPQVSAPQLDKLVELIAPAKRPLIILGGSGWTDASAAKLQAWAEANHLPLTTVFRRQDLMDSDSPSTVGDLGFGANPELLTEIRHSDFILVIGTRLGEVPTQGYQLFDLPVPTQNFVHVHCQADEIGKVFQPDLGIVSGYQEFVDQLVEHPALADLNSASWKGWTEQLRNIYIRWTTPMEKADNLTDLWEVMRWLREELPEDVILTNDAGNFSGWAQRYLKYGRPSRQLGPTNGAMGYAVPAAVAAQYQEPEKLVISMAGDGGFMMTGQEIATAKALGLKGPIFFVFNNSMYGTIRMHQEMHHPNRISGTDLVNPDFKALAESYGAAGFKVESADQFKQAFKDARAAGKPALIEILIDPQQLSTSMRLTEPVE